MENKGILEKMAAHIATLERRVDDLERELRAEQGMKARGAIGYIVARYSWTLNKKKAADILGVTSATIYAMIEDGRLRELADGKVPAESIADYLDGNGGKFVKLRTGPKSKQRTREAGTIEQERGDGGA